MRNMADREQDWADDDSIGLAETMRRLGRLERAEVVTNHQALRFTTPSSTAAAAPAVVTNRSFFGRPSRVPAFG